MPCLALLLIGNGLHAQHLFHTNYTTKDGLPSNHVYGCVEDLEGYLWFYTEKGIAKFDGYEFKVFTTKDGLPSNDVWFLDVDKENRIWIHCRSSDLLYLKNDSVKIAANIGEDVRNLKVYNDDLQSTIVATSVEICYQDEGSELFSCIDKKSIPLYSDTIMQIGRPAMVLVLADSVYLRVDVESKMTIYDHGNFRSYKAKNDVYKIINGGEYILNSDFIVSTNIVEDNVLLYYNHITGIEKSNDDLKILSNYTHIRLNVYNDHIWVFTNAGFLKYDMDFNLVGHYNIDRKVKEFQNISRIYEDRFKNLWISTFDKGVFKVTQKENYVDFLLKENILIDKIIAVDGRVVAASDKVDILISNENNTGFERKKLESKLNHISKVIYEDDGLLRIERGHDIELYHFENNQILNASNKYQKLIKKSIELLGGDCVRTLHFSKPDNYVLVKNCSATTLYYNEMDSLAILRRSIFNAVEQFRDTVFIGYSDGLYSLVDGTFGPTRILTDEPFGYKIIDLKYQENIGLWIATDGHGLFLRKLDHSIEKVANTENYTLGSFELNNNELWFCMDGISKLSTDDTDGYVVNTVYDQKDYFFNSAVNDFVFLDQDIFVGTDLGIFKVPIRTPKSLDVEVDFSCQVFQNEMVLEKSSLSELKHHQNNLSFNFRSISYNERPKYYYQLIGHDPKQLTSEERVINYASLGPGNYSFKCGVVGNEVITEKLIDLCIAPAYYDTTWFRILLFLLTIGVAYWIFLYRYRLREDKRKAALEVEKKFSELELKALQSQLNPHFVFNCLGSIQYLINSNQNEDADTYLSKFASLLRLFLDNSTKKMISVEDELEIIQLYVELEQLRFSDNFSFVMDIDLEDRDQIMVPSLMLQPLVENSISHGLFHRPKGGKLSLTIKEEDHRINIELLDNGIGRAAAETIRRKSLKNYQSKGAKLIMERLETISTNLDLDISLEYEDHPFKDEEYKGTKVVINMDKITEE